MMCQRIGMSPILTKGFGLSSVSSQSQVPAPPQRITTGKDAFRPMRDEDQNIGRLFESVKGKWRFHSLLNGPVLYFAMRVSYLLGLMTQIATNFTRCLT